MTAPQVQALQIFIAIIVGVLAAGYLYESVSDMFSSFRKAIREIAVGMMLGTIGVMIAAFLQYSLELGINLNQYRTAGSITFFILYIVGSVFVLIGARNFMPRHSKNVVDVSLQKIG